MRPAKRRLMLESRLLSLLFWTSVSLTVSRAAENEAPAGVPLGNGRCNTPPCTCDQFDRLTCDCKDAPEVLLLTAEGEYGLSRHTSRLLVTDCPSLVLAGQSLAQMDGLMSVELANVANLTLERHSLKLSPRAVSVRLSLRNASLDLLPSNLFHGDVEAIRLEAVRIGRLAAFGFANLYNTDSISLESCEIEEIEAQAFKKFEVGSLSIVGGSLGSELPSRLVNDVDVQDKLVLEGLSMGRVRSSAFVVKQPKSFSLISCAIESLEPEAFSVSTSGPVVIRNNSFASLGYGPFLGIHADQQHRLVFRGNVLGSFEAGSLLFNRTSFQPELASVLLDQACDCKLLELWRSQLLGGHSTVNRPGLTDPPPSVEPPEDSAEVLFCLGDAASGNGSSARPGSWTSLGEYEARQCTVPAGALLLLLLLVAGVGLLLLLLLLLVFLLAGWMMGGRLCWRNRREARPDGKRWISVPTRAPDLVEAKPKNGPEPAARAQESTDTSDGQRRRITMVVPDGRVYRETEFHVIVEKAEPLTTEL